MRQNPWRYNAPPGWSDTRSAPRDGTVIEIQNNWGIAPWFRLAKWQEGRGWLDANDDRSGCDDGPHVSWRPYSGSVETYRDPTGGAQDSSDYWLQAAGYPPQAVREAMAPSATVRDREPQAAIDAATEEMAEWIDVALDDMGLGQSVCKATKDALAAALANYRALSPSETP